MAFDSNKGVIGAAIGGGSWTVKTIIEKLVEGIDLVHYKQEVLEDITGALISVTVGFFLMRLYRSIFKPKSKDDATK